MARTRREAQRHSIVSDTPKGRFPKSAHLLKHSDFVRVYQQGRRHFSGNMTFFYLQAEAEGADGGRRDGGVRVGFTVPKALGGAVERNRMRRRTREAVRHHLDLLCEIGVPVDVVVNPKKSLLSAEFCEISREVERAFGVIRRACDPNKPTRATRRERRGAEPGQTPRPEAKHS